MLVSGVDGGATKTVAVVGRLDGILLASARGASSNYHNIGVGKAARSIRICVDSACRRAQASSGNLETVIMGLAAMDSPMDFRAGQRVAGLTGLGKRRIVVHLVYNVLKRVKPELANQQFRDRCFPFCSV